MNCEMDEIILNMKQADKANVAERFFDKVFPLRNIKRILLVTPPDADESLFRFDTAQRKRYTNYPPYGLLVIARVLESIGIEVELCNLNFEILQQCRASESEETFNLKKIWQDKLDQQLEDFAPDLVGVTCMFTMTHQSFKEVTERISSQGYPVAIGGVHVSNDINSILNDVAGVHMAFLREGEVAVRALVEAVNKTGPIDNLGQVVLIDGTERIEFNADCLPTEEDINIEPAYHLIDVGDYSTHGTIGAFYCFKPEDTKFATVLSNRGCRAQCTFCSVRNFNGVGVRQRSISSVVDEIKYLQDEHGISHIMWLDDDLLKDHDRAIGLFNEMARQNLSVTWDATNGVIASSCTEEVISAAADSGCIAINIGMESGNREILKSVRKPGTVETFLSAAEVLRKFEKIHSSVFLMIGFPGETMSMIMDTIEVAREMDLDWYRCSQLQPLPNTPIFDAMIAQGLIDKSAGGDLRFNGGAYGKQTELEQGLRLATPNFAEAFSEIPLNSVPSADQLTDIWFFMNYHLNFRRIFGEERPEKITQLNAHLNILADVISPENGFSLYFLAYLDFKKRGETDPLLIDRLERRLETSPYWSDRFAAFGLNVNQLRETNFEIQESPKIVIDGNLSPIKISQIDVVK
jgi:radical SAM superfamily enzyme YgiQ (UPF0313 family)